jgi:type VI secretion system protein ImpG
LVAQRLDDSSAARPELALKFACAPGMGLAELGSAPLRLHLHGERASTSQLYLWFLRHLASARVQVPDGTSLELGGSQVVRAVGFDPREALLPWPTFSPEGPRLLLEYFMLPARYLFLDVRGLERASHLAADHFELIFRFNRPPPLPARLAGDAIRVHCVPAHNLFEVSAEPVRVESDARPSLLRAAAMDPLHAEVFAVRSVTSVSRANASADLCEPFHSFRHVTGPRARQGYYKLRRELSPIDDGIHTYIRVDRGVDGLVEGQTLSIELEATNRSLPSELQVGDVCVSTSDVPAGVAFSNIGLVSKPARPPLGSELSWRFLSHLACSRRSLADLEVLKALLSLYCAQAGTDTPTARANQQRIDAIRSVSATAITRVVRGAAVLGTLYEIGVDQESFEGEGDAFLFGSVLHRVLGLNERMNSYADLALTLHPSRAVYRFHAEFSR